MYETPLAVLDCWLIAKFAVCTFATLDAYNMLTYSFTETNYLQKWLKYWWTYKNISENYIPITFLKVLWLCHLLLFNVSVKNYKAQFQIGAHFHRDEHFILSTAWVLTHIAGVTQFHSPIIICSPVFSLNTEH